MSADKTVPVTLPEWAPAQGFESHYEVSSIGEVRRTAPGRGARTGLVLTPEINERGYRSVKLRMDGARAKRWVHRLVCEAFHGKPPPGQVVRHLDGNPANNAASNLAWGTQAENAADTTAHGRDRASWVSCRRGHLLREPNLTERGIRKGFRECRACSVGRDRVGHRGRTDIQVESDAAYREITGSSHG
jgi:hypothetical protein